MTNNRTELNIMILRINGVRWIFKNIMEKEEVLENYLFYE